MAEQDGTGRLPSCPSWRTAKHGNLARSIDHAAALTEPESAALLHPEAG